MTIRVLIADDQDMVRAGFRLILSSTDGIEVVGEADNGRDAVAKAQHLRPDVCLFDIRMPELDGIEATRILAGPAVDEPMRVVIITTFDTDEYLHDALQAGAIGFLLKSSGPELLVEAVRAATDGESLISPRMTTRLLDQLSRPERSTAAEPREPLTDRELEVLDAVAEGRTNAEVSDTLHISLSTVKAHIASLMSKVGARNRVELVIWAYDSGRR